MGDLFRGWKRKLGLVALLMACALMIAWLRGRGRISLIEICCFGSRINLVSGCGEFQFVEGSLPRFRLIAEETGIEMELYFEKSAGATKWPTRIVVNEWSSLTLRTRISLDGDESSAKSIPYWSIVIPLVLLSAWLLLSKPRQTPVTCLAPATDDPRAERDIGEIRNRNH